MIISNLFQGQSTVPILVCPADDALALLPDGGDTLERQWYQWQPGVLQLYSPLPGYLGGLTSDKSSVVFVAFALYDQRRREVLRERARQVGIREEEIEAFCDQAEQEIKTDGNPRPHPAFAADAEARQVPYWLSQLAQQRQS